MANWQPPQQPPARPARQSRNGAAVAAVVLLVAGITTGIAFGVNSGGSSGTPFGQPSVAGPTIVPPSVRTHPSIAPAPSVASGQVVWGESTEFPTNLMPLIIAGNSTAVGNLEVRVLDGPFRTSPNVSYIPDADQASATSSIVGGQQVVDIKINPSAVWADGQPITADDYAFTFATQKSFDPATGGCAALLSTTGFDQVEKTEKVGEKELRVYFRAGSPFADWRGLVSGGSAPVLSKHVFDKGSASATCAYITNGWPVATGIPLGAQNGPWLLTSDNVNTGSKTITLVPNPKYWGAKPKLLRLVHRTVGATSDTTLAALQNNAVDIAYPQPQLDLVAGLKSLTGVTTTISFGSSYEHLDFNVADPLLKYPQVRQAIALAIDRRALVAATVGKFSDRAAPLGNRLLLNTQTGYVDHSGEYAAPNIVKAKQLIQSVGGKQGPDGIFRIGGRPLSFKIITTQENPLRDQTIATMGAQVKAAGIRLTEFADPSIFEDKSKADSLEAERFQIAMFAWVGSPALSSSNAIYLTKTRGGGQNYSQGSDPVVDADLARVSAAPTPQAEIAAANAADARLWTDMFTLPLYQKPTLLAFRNNIAGLADNGTLAGPLWNSETFSVR